MGRKNDNGERRYASVACMPCRKKKIKARIYPLHLETCSGYVQSSDMTYSSAIMNNLSAQIVACIIRIASWARTGEGTVMLQSLVHFICADQATTEAPRP